MSAPQGESSEPHDEDEDAGFYCVDLSVEQLREEGLSACVDVEIYGFFQVTNLTTELRALIDALEQALEARQRRVEECEPLEANAVCLRNLVTLYDAVSPGEYTDALEATRSFHASVLAALPGALEAFVEQVDVVAKRARERLLQPTGFPTNDEFLAYVLSPVGVWDCYELCLAVAKLLELLERTPESDVCEEVDGDRVEELVMLESEEPSVVIMEARSLVEFAVRLELALVGDLPGPAAVLVAVGKFRLARRISSEQLDQFDAEHARQREEITREGERQTRAAQEQHTRANKAAAAKFDAGMEELEAQAPSRAHNARLPGSALPSVEDLPTQRGRMIYRRTIERALTSHIDDAGLRQEASRRLGELIDEVEGWARQGSWNHMRSRHVERLIRQEVEKYVRDDRTRRHEARKAAWREAFERDSRAISQTRNEQLAAIEAGQRTSLSDLEGSRQSSLREAARVSDEALESRWKFTTLGGTRALIVHLGLDLFVVYCGWSQAGSPLQLPWADIAFGVAGAGDLVGRLAAPGSALAGRGAMVARVLGPLGATIAFAQSFVALSEVADKRRRGAATQGEVLLQLGGFFGAGIFLLSLTISGPVGWGFAIVGGLLSIAPIMGEALRTLTTSAGRLSVQRVLDRLEGLSLSGYEEAAVPVAPTHATRGSASRRRALEVLDLSARFDEVRTRLLAETLQYAPLPPVFGFVLEPEDAGTMHWMDAEAFERRIRGVLNRGARSPGENRAACIQVLTQWVGLGEDAAQSLLEAPPPPVDSKPVGDGVRRPPW